MTTTASNGKAIYSKAEAMLIIRSRLDMLEDGEMVLDPMILWALKTVKPIMKRGRELYTTEGQWFDWYKAVRDDVKISRKWGWENDKGAYTLSFKP